MYNTVGLEELVLEVIQHVGNWIFFEKFGGDVADKMEVRNILKKLTSEQKIEEKYNMWRAIFEN